MVSSFMDSKTLFIYVHTQRHNLATRGRTRLGGERERELPFWSSHAIWRILLNRAAYLKFEWISIYLQLVCVEENTKLIILLNQPCTIIAAASERVYEDARFNYFLAKWSSSGNLWPNDERPHTPSNQGVQCGVPPPLNKKRRNRKTSWLLLVRRIGVY